MSSLYSRYVVVCQNTIIGPYGSQAAATRIANKLKMGAYTRPLLSWRESFAARYFMEHRAKSWESRDEQI